MPPPAIEPEALADEDRRHGRGHQRGGASRNRIDLTEVADTIALDQAGK